MVTGAVIAAAGVGAVAGVAADRAAEEVAPLTRIVTASEPSIRIIEMPTANAEYELRVPASCKKFMLQMRDGTTFKVATIKNGTKAATPWYFTVRANAVVWWDGLNVTDPKEAVFYISCAVATKVAEIWQWS